MTERTGQDLITVELHCHTCFSPDSLMRPAELVRLARRRGLDRLAVTDHNSIQGALACAELDPELVIVGEEILTTEGELLAFFVQQEVPAGLTPAAALETLKEQGAFISVSHPFDPHRKGAWSPEALDRIRPHIDAVEGFNARTFSDGPNQRAAAYAAEHGLLQTAGSDAHAGIEVGRAVLRTRPFDDADGMRAALTDSERIGGRSPAWVHLFSRWASWRKRLGWSHPACGKQAERG